MDFWFMNGSILKYALIRVKNIFSTDYLLNFDYFILNHQLGGKYNL